jgi:hypothetical protein
VVAVSLDSEGASLDTSGVAYKVTSNIFNDMTQIITSVLLLIL